jgi:hypothetical protein
VACNWGDDVAELAVDGDAEVITANTDATPHDGALRLAPDMVVVLRSTE